jgi:hypothetical protein
VSGRARTRADWSVPAFLYGGALPWVSHEDGGALPLDVLILRATRRSWPT